MSIRHVLLLASAASFVLSTSPVQAAVSGSKAPAHRSKRTASVLARPENQIIVTATPFAQGLADTPAITATVSSNAILQSGGASIGDSLSSVPGVSTTGFASGASRPIIRGLGGDRVLILEDGTSVSDVSDVGPDHGVPIDPLAARSIEVIRGVATLRYGSQAIGGVVDVINNRVPRTLPDTPISGEVTASHDTVDSGWQGSALTDVAVGKLALHADGFYRDTGDYETPLGVQQNSFFNGKGGSLGGTWFFSPGTHVGAAIEQYDSKYGIPSDISYINMKQTKLMTRSVFALGSGLFKSFSFVGSYANYHHDEIANNTIAATFRNKEGDGRAELQFNPLGILTKSAVGVEHEYRKFSALGDGANYLLPTTTDSTAAYLFLDTRPTASLTLEASGRIERVIQTGTPASGIPARRSFTPASAAIGALYNAGSGIKLGLVLSSTGRAPAITELFARGPHDGPNTFETGNPDLAIERANSIEGSLRVHSGEFHFDGSIFSTWFSHFIYGDLTGRTCDASGVCTSSPDGTYRELFYRQQDAHFRGIEGKATYDVIDNDAGQLELDVMGGFTRATFGDGSNVPRIPPWRLGGGVTWHGAAIDAGMTLTRVGRQGDYGTYDTATPGYTNLDAQIAWRPFANHRGIEFSLVGKNLTDSVQRNAAALNKDLVVMPGRDIRLVAKLAI